MGRTNQMICEGVEPNNNLVKGASLITSALIARAYPKTMLAHNPTFRKLKNKTWPVFLFNSFLENPDFFKIKKIKSERIKNVKDFKKII